MKSLDELGRILLLLTAMTEYRELLYQAAVDGFERPVLLEGRVRLEQGRTEPGSVPDDVRVIDHGALRVDLDSFSFKGSRQTQTAADRHVTSLQEDIGIGQVSVYPAGARPWHLLEVSPVGVFAAATACRMTAEESRRHRAHPARTAADLLDPDAPTLLVPGDDLVLELEGLCRELDAVGPR